MNKLNLSILTVALLCVSLGCLGPGSDETRCEGILRSNGETYVGKAKTEEQAKLNACNKFCLDDEEYEAMYRIWLDSEKAKRLEKSRGKKVSKEDAVFEDKRLLDFVTKNCAPRCRDEADKGKHTLQAACKK